MTIQAKGWGPLVYKFEDLERISLEWEHRQICRAYIHFSSKTVVMGIYM